MKNVRQSAICFAILLGIFLLLSGCGSTPKTEPTAGAQAASTITGTSTPIPSTTKQPSSTLTVTATKNLTQIAFETSYAPTVRVKNPSIKLTAVALETWMAAFSEKCQMSSLSISPNGNWAAKSCGYYAGDSKIVVTAKDGREWVFKAQDYLPPEESANMAAAGLILQTWSPDSRYLFFSSQIFERDGGGICFYGSFGEQGLFRLDVQTGKVSTILALLDSHHTGYIVTFSPTGRRFAYTKGRNEFHIIDILTGQDSTIQTDEPNGSLTWSLDGLSLAFSTSKCDDEHGKVIHSIIKVLQTTNLSVKTILRSDKEFLRVDHWVSNNFLVVESYSIVDDPVYGYQSTRSLLTIDVNRKNILFSTTDTP